MNNETFELFFAILAVATLVGTLIVLASRTILRTTGFGASVIVGFRPFARPLSAAIATTCMLGSLYFSEIVNYKPCRLCWYQRGFMYPLAILLIVFTVIKTARIGRIVVPLAAIGAGISLYHWLLERFPDNLDSGVCSKDVPCEFIWFELFGFVTLPFMALTGFLAIIVFNTLPKPTE
ncbi:MAG: disulfide bond formation protein B [Ilumatobacteraceae bacterium]